MGTPLRLTVCGAGGAGLAIAADSALKGIDVTLFELPQLAEKLEGPRARGGIEVTADSETTAGRTGFAPLAASRRRRGGGRRRRRDHDHRAGDVPRRVHGRRRAAPRDGQIVLFNTGYWGVAPAGAAAGPAALPDVTLAESNIMPYICQPRRRRHPHRPLQAALLRRRVPRRAERRHLRRRAPHLHAVRPGAHGPRHQHRRRRQPADPRDPHHPHRRPLLRPLHGRQVLPGHDHPRRAAGHGVRRRARAARRASRVGAVRGSGELRSPLVSLRGRGSRADAALVAARRLVRDGGISGTSGQRGHHLRVRADGAAGRGAGHRPAGRHVRWSR